MDRIADRGLWVGALGALLASGRVAPQRPDIDTWLSTDDPALGSPRLADALRDKD